jgi:hypothetical protein
VALTLCLGLTAVVGCDSGANEAELAILRVHLTDAPFPFDMVDSANVVISRIEVFGSDDTTRAIMLADTARMYNLLDLQNGVTTMMSETLLPATEYVQFRLIVDSAWVVLTDQRRFDLKVPSGSQTGIKVKLESMDLSLAPESVTDVTLDFDVSESFVVQGNPDTPAGISGFSFKPVVKPLSVVVGAEEEESGEES